MNLSYIFYLAFLILVELDFLIVSAFPHPEIVEDKDKIKVYDIDKYIDER